MKQKILMLFICMLCCLLIAGCGNQDLGGFQDVEVTEEVEKEPETIFTKAKDTLGYDYQKVKIGRSGVVFEVPKAWSVEVVNGRHVFIQAPNDDPYLPGMSLHYYSMLQVPEDNEYLSTVGKYDTFFNRDMEITKYNFGGKYYSLYGEFKPEEKDTDTSITKGNDKLTSIAYSSYPSLISHTMDPLGDDAAILAYYVKWYDTPAVFTCAFPDDKKKTVQDLLRYVVSSMTTYDPAEPEYEEVKINGIKLNLPSDFEEQSSDMYMVPLSNPTQHCGFAVSVQDIDKQTKETLPKTVDAVSNSIISNQAGTNINTHYEAMHSAGNAAEILPSSSALKMYCYTVFRKIPYLYEDTSYWNDYYNGVPTMYTTYYYYDGKLIAFTWTTDQMDEALAIEQNIENSIKTSN